MCGIRRDRRHFPLASLLPVQRENTSKGGVSTGAEPRGCTRSLEGTAAGGMCPEGREPRRTPVCALALHATTPRSGLCTLVVGGSRVPACRASPRGRSGRSAAEHPGATQGPSDLPEHPLLRLTHRDRSRSPPSRVEEPGRQKSDPGKPSQWSSLGCRGDRPSKDRRDFPSSPGQRCGKLAGERALVGGKTFPGLSPGFACTPLDGKHKAKTFCH